MGNICDCLAPATIAEPEYTPIETTEIVQPAGKPRPVERGSTNNYQSILEKASGSKYRTSRSDGVAITSGGSSEGAESVRSRFTKAEVNPQVVCSPPSTGIVLQSYSTFTSQGAKGNGQSDNTNESNGMNGASRGAISALHVKPCQDTMLEGAADSLAQLVVKQTERSIDKFSSNPNECSAVVGFKPFETASISAR